MTCDYCKTNRPIHELEVRKGRLVCKDRAACDAAEAAEHEARFRELRALRRAGHELTDAEKAELADAG